MKQWIYLIFFIMLYRSNILPKCLFPKNAHIEEGKKDSFTLLTLSFP